MTNKERGAYGDVPPSVPLQSSFQDQMATVIRGKSRRQDADTPAELAPMPNAGRKWLIVTQYYYPEIGAAAIRLRAFVKELLSNGERVRVVTAMPNYPTGRVFPGYRHALFKRETVDGIEVLRGWIYPGTGRSPFRRLANYLSFTCSAFLMSLCCSRPDIVFLESQPLSLGIVGLAMKWIRRVPYVYNVPDLQVDVAQQMGFIHSARFLRWAQWLEDLFVRKSWKVATVTHQFIDHFEARGLPRSQITFLPNGADTQVLLPRPASEDLRRRWGLDGKRVIVYVGTHAYYHGLDTLIHAAQLLGNRTDIHFLLIGDGPERARIIAMARDLKLENTTFGSSPYEEMAELYSVAYASIAVLRNIPVAQGMRLSKVFPSLSCGVPVLYSGRGEASQLLTSAGCGVTVEPERPDLLAEAIRNLVDDPRRRDELGRRGRELVVCDYSWKVIVQRWLQEVGFDGRVPHA